MKLVTFETCGHGHPLEWDGDTGDYYCRTCKAAVEWQVKTLVARVQQINPNPIRPLEGPGFVMIGRAYEPPINLRSDPPYYLQGALGGLAVVLAALCVGAAIVYFRMPSIFNL